MSISGTAFVFNVTKFDLPNYGYGRTFTFLLGAFGRSPVSPFEQLVYGLRSASVEQIMSYKFMSQAITFGSSELTRVTTMHGRTLQVFVYTTELSSPVGQETT